MFYCELQHRKLELSLLN